MNAFISVVTVSLNAARTIDDTLASVMLQRAPFVIEQVCVDGGSRDGTREIIDGRAGAWPQLRRVYEPDHGIYDAMNRGLRAASGEYLLFLNADDFLVAPDSLARAVANLRPGDAQNPGLIAGDVAMGTLGGWGVWRHRRVPALLGRVHGSGLFPVHQGLLCSRQLLLAAGGFDDRLRLAADVTLYYALERNFRPGIHKLGWDLAFMRAGGSANAGPRAIYLGSREIFDALVPEVGRGRAALMVLVKTLQSLSELRIGSCAQERWFVARSP